MGLLNCIEFGQYVTQAMWVKDSSLLQLPHFTGEEVKHAQKGKGKATNVLDYKALDDDQRKGVADFTDEQKQDVSKYLKVIPDITVGMKVYVDDDEDDKIYEGDLCTVRVTLTRNNLEKGEKAGLVHAPRFPFPKREAWWIILGTKEGKIIHIEKVGDPSRVVEHKIVFLAPRVGDYDFDLYVKANVEEDSDDEDDSDSEDEDHDDEKTSVKEAIAPKSEADMKKDRLKNARNQDDDDSDDDEAEEVYAD